MSKEYNGDRLERIEALVEKIGQRVDSNVRAIQALTENNTEAKKERAKLYQIMSDLAQSHAYLAQAQADNQKLLYRFMEYTEDQQQRLIKTQADITEILKILTNKNRE